MSDLGTTAFDNSEKIDILIKENFNVSSTNENTPWYLENNATFNTYVNGKDILLDEIPNTVNWSSSSFLTESELSLIYGLTSSDFYSGGGVKVDSTGVLHKFIKLKLQPIPGTSITSGSTTTYFSYYHKNSNGINLLENSFQLNHGDGSSFAYSMYSNDGIANNVSILQDSNGGNWFFNFKNGIVFVPDPTKNSTMLSNVNQNNLPYFTFVKYIGRKGIAKQISVVQNKTTITNPENNQIAVQTSDNTLHRYDTSTTSWISIGGSGGGGSSTTITSLNDVSDVTYPSGGITNGYVLKWNSTTSKWEPSVDAQGTTINSLNDIADVDVNTKDDGQVLKWNGNTGKWEAKDDNAGSGSGSGNGVTVIPSSASVDLSENILYPTADTGSGKEGDIIYDASENLFYEASNSKTDTGGNGEIAFRPLGYSFFAKNMEGQAPNVQSTSFFFFELTPSSIVLHWTNPVQYETGITASSSQLLNENAPIVSQPSGGVGGKINFPIVNRIMLQIKNLETNQYITWGSKRSPVSQYVTGLTGGYVICSKDYPIPPMNSNINFGDSLSDGGRSSSVYKLEDFAQSIIIYSTGNTPTNDIIKSGITSYPKRIFPVYGETNKELSSSNVGYEIKFWYENEYKVNPNSTLENGWGMTENDFNVITLNQARDQNGDLILDDGKINFLAVQPPSESLDCSCSIVFNNLGNVSNGSTIVEIKVKDPEYTTATGSQYNTTINLTEIKFEYRNNAASGTTDGWNSVKKIFDKNAGSTSSNTSIANKGQQGSKVILSSGVYSINRKRDDNYRYFYVELNNDMIGLTNFAMEKYLSFRISYKNASTDEFGDTKVTNELIFDKPNKPTISEIKMTSYNTFTVTLASFSDTEDIIGDTTEITNNNMGVFLRNINFNVAYQYSDETSQTNITTFTGINGGESSQTTSTSMPVYINTTSFGSSTYTYTLPAGFYPDGSTNTNPITYYFSASVQNNLISSYSEVSDQQSIQITKPNSSMTITLAPQTSGSNYNNKILATLTAPSNGNRGIVSAQADAGLPNLQKYTFQSTNLKNVDSDVAVEHTNTINTSNRNVDPSTQRMLTFYDSLKGTTGSVTKSLDLAVREYNEYVNDNTEVTTSVNATATKPELVTISTHTNLVISNTNSKNTVKLNWAHPTNRGLTIGGNNIRNTILTYTINIERAATTNKYLIDNSNQTDATYETTTTQSDTSNDKTGTADATNTKTLTSDNDGSLLWPDSTYNYTVRATNSLGYQSDAQTTTKGTFTTNTPTIPTAFNYFNDSRLNSLRNTYDLINNNSYQYLGVLVSEGISSSTNYSDTAVQITNYNNLSDITSGTVTHVLNKKHLQEFTNSLSNSLVQSWSSSVPTTANQAGFKIVNAADSDAVLYTIGMSTNHTTETEDDTVFQVLRTDRKDIYSETYDDRNRGYWLKETIQYKINLATQGNLTAYLYKPLKLELKSYYNETGSGTISTTQTGETVILQNSYSTNPNDNVYLDVLNNNPSIVKNSSYNMITYTPLNQINGVPNLARGGTIILKYKLENYSQYYLLNSSVNVAEHYFSYATSSANSVISWTSKIGGTRNINHWIVDKTLSSIPSTNTATSGITIKIRAKNTKGTTDLTIGSSHSSVYNFIYDKPSSDLINELKNASEAAHSTSSASNSTQNGQIMEVPSDFNPNELSSTTTQGADFNDTVFNQFSSDYNSKQLILFNGKFSTPKYLYDSNITFYNALHSNKSTYGITQTFKDNSDTNYSWVIYKFIREYTGSGTQNLNWFVLSFNENSNITSTHLENGDAQIWIQTKITTDGSSYTTHTYTANPADNAPGSLKWINYKPSGANNTQSVAATLGEGADLGANNNSSSFDQTGNVGASGINISGTTYSSKKRNLVGVINNVSKISSSGNIIYYIAVGLKNNVSLWVSKPASFDAFLPDKNISR